MMTPKTKNEKYQKWFTTPVWQIMETPNTMAPQQRMKSTKNGVPIEFNK